MSTAIEQAEDFLVKSEGLEGDEWREAYKALPPEVQRLYDTLRKVRFLKPENEVKGSREETSSPSGAYRLVVSEFSEGPGTWAYSQGIVYRKDDGIPIATVQRNYSAFPHHFVEGHPNGHSYLVCGEDYQGQTVVELDTGARRDVMSDGAGEGTGFCWASYSFHAPTRTLVVEGCHWACPYEFRFYDFSDPMSGWPEIKLPEWLEADAKAPDIDGDIIRAYKTRALDDESVATDKENAGTTSRPVDVVLTLRREGLTLVKVDEWVSDYERDQRKKREESEREEREWRAYFRANDPLYLAYAKLVKSEVRPDTYEGFGITYDEWGGEWKGRERRLTRRIVGHKGKTGPIVDLEWAVETGPIKLVLFRDGKSAGTRFFPHSVEGMEQAFAAAKAFAHAE